MATHVLALTVDLRIADAFAQGEARRDQPHPRGRPPALPRGRPAEAGTRIHHRAELGFVAVSGSAHATEVIDEVERFVWSFPEVEVVDAERKLARGRLSGWRRALAETPGSTRAPPG